MARSGWEERLKGPSSSSSSTGCGGGGGLADLPESLIAEILSHMTPKELVKLARVNRLFYQASQSDPVWDKMLPQGYSRILELASNPPSSKCKSKRQLYDFFCTKLLINNDTQEYWVDRASGQVCQSLSGRALNIMEIEHTGMWEWIPAMPGSRFKEVAYKKGSDHTEVRGRIECCLPPGSYLISWRLQVGMQPIYRANRAVQRDFTLQHTMPCRFSMWTGDDGCHNFSERFLDCMQRPEGDDKWLEYDGGEFTVERQDQPFDLHFSLMEMTAGVWRSGLLLDCVVIRPTQLTSKSHQKVEVLVADEDPSEVLWYLPTVGALWGRSGASSKPRGTRQKKDGNCILVNGPFPDSQKV
ncbi:unnamed protein product [Sphagnum troendelagicum]|uniref:F-box domain-containing protein n=1 Tax=Sphagnum troendelagicum TaxID=128251 RepID=A0ABP0TN23_9BRYO